MWRARTAPTATGSDPRTPVSGRPVPGSRFLTSFETRTRPETRLGQRSRRVPVKEAPAPWIAWTSGGTSRVVKRGISAVIRRRILAYLGLL
jgi:hypothetical protein